MNTNNDNLMAIVRELRKSAETLAPSRRREVNNKLDRICVLMRDRAVAPVDKTVAPEIEGQGEHYESQAKAVLAWMRAGHTITSLEALRRFGIISFPRRILDIEKLTGIAPKRKRIQVENRAGKLVYVNEYWMEEN